MRVSNNATAHDVVKNFSQLHYPEERLAVVETTYTEFIDRNVELLVANGIRQAMWRPHGLHLLFFRFVRRGELSWR